MIQLFFNLLFNIFILVLLNIALIIGYYYYKKYVLNKLDKIDNLKDIKPDDVKNLF
jgi:hypothetical protein